MFLQYLINGLIMGGIYSLVSLGFALIYNTTKIFHISYAVLYMISPYMLLTFYVKLGWGIFPAFLFSVVITMILSLLIDLLVYRPLSRKNSSQNIILISSIGVMTVVINVVAMFYGNEAKIFNNDVSKTVEFGRIVITYIQLYQLAISLLIFLVFFIFLKFTRFGILTRAMRDDSDLCRVYGKNIEMIRTLLFLLSGLFAAVGGGLVALDVGMDPYVGMSMLLNAMVALIIGGVGRFEAPVIGGFIIGVLQALTIWVFSARWENAIIFVILIVFLLFRPQGLIGEKQRVV